MLKGACGIDMSPLDISLAIDASVDQGQAVPKIVRIGQTWLRAFYSGEGEYNQPLLQFKTATYRAYAEYCRQRNVEKLNRFDFHKLCVALKDMLPWLPISTRSYTYGYFVTVGNDEEELVDWLTEGDSSPLSLDRQSGRIQVRKGYRSPVRPTWPPDKESQFFYAFHFTATAFSRIKRDADRAKLLLTTCRTQVDTYEAVACEAHSWIEHARYDFGKFLNEAGALACADGNKPEALNRAVTSLFWSMTYVSEATKKRHIFYEEFARLYSALKKAFVSQGSPAKTFWQCHVEGPGLMDSTRDDGADRQFDMLMKIVFLMAKATNFATRTFMEFDIITYDDLRECFRRHKVDVENNAFAWIIQEPCWDAAASYNRMAQSARAAGLQGISAVLPSERPSGDPSAWVHGALQALGACHAELAAAVREICPRRELLEGQRFQYAWNLLPPSALAEDDRSYQTVFKW
ncbi:MAG: hypothetical protein HN919_01810 [Verrucomicrobia bacterium]|nr:hypothetical protein [Verrucomicrobiota bacterium]